MRKLKNLLGNVLSLVVSILVTLLLIEMGFRLFLPQELITPMPAVADPELIYKLPPHTRAHLKGTSVRWFHLETNSQGLRDREYPFEKATGTFRILLLGDSMSMAEGVELEETYIKILERQAANAVPGKKLEAVNAAIRGYGNDQETILFERIGQKFHPDLVILAFFEGNDITDNANGGIFQLKDGRLMQTLPDERNSPKLRYYRKQITIQNFPGYRFLISHSHVVNYLRVTYAGHLNRQHLTTKFSSDNGGNIKNTDWALTAQILARWKRGCEAVNAVPILLYLPTVDHVRALKAPKPSPGNIHALMTTFVKDHRIPFVDLTAAFVDHPDPEALYLPDAHLSVQGHAYAAKIMLQVLVDAKLLR